MKFDDVIVKEGFASDLKDKILGNKVAGAKDNSMSAGGAGNMTYRDNLAQKIFFNNFMSDAEGTVTAGINGGLVNPPVPAKGETKGFDFVKDEPPGPKSNIDIDGKDENGQLVPGFQEKFRRMFNPRMVDKEAYGQWVDGQGDHSTERDGWGNKKDPKNQEKIWQQYTIAQLQQGGYPANPKGLSSQEIRRAYPGWNGKLDERIMESMDYKHAIMDDLLESIIEATDQDVAKAAPLTGRNLDEFLRDWYGQWMGGIDLTKSKAASDKIIDQIFAQYNASKNPNKPTIAWPLFQQLGQTAWSASKSMGIMPAGAPDQLSKNTQTAQGELVAQMPDQEFMQTINVEAIKRKPLVIKDESFILTELTADGYRPDENHPAEIRQWTKVSGEEATVNQSKALNAYVQNQGDQFGYLDKEEPKIKKEPKAQGAELNRDTFDTSLIPVGTTYNASRAKIPGDQFEWNGVIWVSASTGKEASEEASNEMLDHWIENNKAIDSTATTLNVKDTVAESKTQSAIRAEKISQLSTR